MLRVRTEHGLVTLDMLFGAAVFGVVGAAIGYYLMGTVAGMSVTTAVGLTFGGLIGLFGGRRFFLSIVCGAIMGGSLAWLVSGPGMVPLGAGSGGAVGGFLGVQVGMLLDLWTQSRQTSTPESSPSEGGIPR